MCLSLFTEPERGQKTSRNWGTSWKMTEEASVKVEREIELISSKERKSCSKEEID